MMSLSMYLLLQMSAFGLQIYRFRHFSCLRMNTATFTCTKMLPLLPKVKTCIRPKDSD